MKHHTLILNYSGQFKPSVDPLLVKDGDTISFQLGNAPPNSTFKITFNDPELFSVPSVSDSNTKVGVIRAAVTTYQCQLFDSNKTLLAASSETQQGGGIRPE